jgi:hypothetical protein
MIYTSYFGNYRKFPEHSYLVSISLYPPKGFKGEKLSELDNNNGFLNIIPNKKLLSDYKSKLVDNVGYAKQYIEQLKLVDFENFCSVFEHCILLCYESNAIDPSTGKPFFCHRHVLRFYMNRLGYKIKEL